MSSTACDGLRTSKFFMPKLNVLVVEGDPIDRMNIKMALEEHHQVEVATNAEEGFQTVLEKDIHVVVTSHHFGRGITGRQLSVDIKRLLHPLPVILMSKFAEPFPHGADRFISKPFKTETLLEIIADLVRTHRIVC